MTNQASREGRSPRRLRSGDLFLLIGAIVVLVPVGFWAFDELSYRWQMAQVPTPSPVIASPPESQVTQLPPPAPSAPPSPQPPSPPQSDRGYQVEIPRIGVSYLVGEGVDDPVLAKGPGHYAQTVLPGEEGNAALAGHRTIKGRPAFFYRLNELQPGDEVHIRYQDRSLTFQVEQVFLTTPYDLSVLGSTPHPALTLTTCDPPGSDEQRLIVRSRLLRVEANP